MGLHAFGFHKFYSIIIRYIWLITAIDIQTLYNFSHKLSHSFTIFHNSFQHIRNSSLLSTITLVFILSDFSYWWNFFPEEVQCVTHIIHIFLAWLTTSQPTTSLTYIHSILFTKMIKVPDICLIMFVFPVIQMFQFTLYIFFGHNIGMHIFFTIYFYWI